jgi:NDP-4-keto-2,6-dideoxyhexose 3-C-methyltransferase
VELIEDFFSASVLKNRCGGKKAAVITSFSMLYDLPNPLEFMREIREVLAEDGIWVFEQSYLPAMLQTNSFDTVCHEHLEYYGLEQIAWAAARVGFDLLNVTFNDINGGSFSVIATPSRGAPTLGDGVARALLAERQGGWGGAEAWRGFNARVAGACAAVRSFLADARSRGERVVGLGASTKGNVLLQRCGIGPGDLDCIAEVNPDKYGRVAPGSGIPIRPQAEVLRENPDFFLVLPWHFRSFFQHNSNLFGRRLVFPLPQLEIIKTMDGSTPSNRDGFMHDGRKKAANV